MYLAVGLRRTARFIGIQICLPVLGSGGSAWTISITLCMYCICFSLVLSYVFLLSSFLFLPWLSVLARVRLATGASGFSSGSGLHLVDGFTTCVLVLFFAPFVDSSESGLVAAASSSVSATRRGGGHAGNCACDLTACELTA